MNSEANLPGLNQTFRDAAIANLFMGLANNGGLNGFLTSTYDFDAAEVVDALGRCGATVAAEQLGAVLGGMGVPLPRQSQIERWKALDKHWSDELDSLETLTLDADQQLMEVLSEHVAKHLEHYLTLT
jgi:hypothetical protein